MDQNSKELPIHIDEDEFSDTIAGDELNKSKSEALSANVTHDGLNEPASETLSTNRSVEEPDDPEEGSFPTNENGSIEHTEHAPEFVSGLPIDRSSGLEQEHISYDEEHVIYDDDDELEETSDSVPSVLPKIAFVAISIGLLTFGAVFAYKLLNTSNEPPSSASIADGTPLNTLSASMDTANPSAPIDTKTILKDSESNIYKPDVKTGVEDVIDTLPVAIKSTPPATISELITSRVTLISLKAPKYLMTADGESYSINDSLNGLDKTRYEIVDIRSDGITVIDLDKQGAREQLSITID